MKKTMIKLSTLAVLATSLILTSCKKDENDETVAPALGTAKISGLIAYDQNRTANTPRINEKAAAGLVVVATYSTSDLVNGTPNPITKSITTTTDATGKYEFNVECGDQNLTVTIAPNDLRDNQVVSSSVTTSDVIFSFPSQDVTVNKGAVKYVDFLN